MTDAVQEKTAPVETPTGVTIEDVAPAPVVRTDGPTSDPVYKSELAKMTSLDEKVNPGMKMGTDVEAQYRKLIDSHEQQPQSDVDRSLALAGRMRMLEHFNSAGDSTKVLQMAIETGQKYPEALSNNRYSSIAANNFLQLNPEFKGILSHATTDQRAMFSQFSHMKPKEEAEYQQAAGFMKTLDPKVNDPGTHEQGMRDYWQVVADSEHPNQSRAERRIGGAARMRIVEHMNNENINNPAGGDSAALVKVMQESMTKYPELISQARFTHIAAGLGAGDNADFVAAYKKAGGDPERLRRN